MFSRLETSPNSCGRVTGAASFVCTSRRFSRPKCCCRSCTSLLEAQPDTDIHINTVQALESHPADADVSIVVNAAPEDGLSCHKLFSQAFVPACSPQLLARSPIRLVCRSESSHVDRPRGASRRLGAMGRIVGTELRPKKVIRFDTMSAAAQAAEHGVGVALVSVATGHRAVSAGLAGQTVRYRTANRRELLPSLAARGCGPSGHSQHSRNGSSTSSKRPPERALAHSPRYLEACAITTHAFPA